MAYSEKVLTRMDTRYCTAMTKTADEPASIETAMNSAAIGNMVT
jgi:hypothetical protein